MPVKLIFTAYSQVGNTGLRTTHSLFPFSYPNKHLLVPTVCWACLREQLLSPTCLCAHLLTLFLGPAPPPDPLSQANPHQHMKTFKRKRQNLLLHIFLHSYSLLVLAILSKHFKSMVSTFSPPIHSSVHCDLTSAQSFTKTAPCKESNDGPVKSKEQSVYYPTCHLPYS